MVLHEKMTQQNVIENTKQFMMMYFDEDMDKLEVIFDGVQSIHDIKLYDLMDIHDMLIDRIKIFDYLLNQYERQIDEYHPDYFDVHAANEIRATIKNEIQNKLQDRKLNLNEERKKCYHKWTNQFDIENELESLYREEKYIEDLLTSF